MTTMDKQLNYVNNAGLLSQLSLVFRLSLSVKYPAKRDRLEK